LIFMTIEPEPAGLSTRVLVWHAGALVHADA
jgi:hypothetical protein